MAASTAPACGENFRRLLDAHIRPTSTRSAPLQAPSRTSRLTDVRAGIPISTIRTSSRNRKNTVLFTASALPNISAQTWRSVLSQAGAASSTRSNATAPAIPHADEFYAGLEHVVRGIQDRSGATQSQPRKWPPKRSAHSFGELGGDRSRQFSPGRRAAADIPSLPMDGLVPHGRAMYNGSGALGRLDVLLTPFYEKEWMPAIDEEAASISPVCCCAIQLASSLAGRTPPVAT